MSSPNTFLAFSLIILVSLGEARALPHPLQGDYKGYMECHILPDWLLIYKIKDDELVLVLSRTGTHSDLF